MPTDPSTDICRLINEKLAARVRGTDLSTGILINEKLAALALGIEVSTLRRWRWMGKPPRFFKIGNAVRYDLRDLAEFIEASRRTSTSDVGAAAA